MEFPGSSISLKTELEARLREKDRGGRITCLGVTVKGVPCKKPLSKATHLKLTPILEAIIENLEDDDYEIEKWLKEATSLAVCSYHTAQAEAAFEHWSAMVPAKASTVTHGGGTIKESSSEDEFEDSGYHSDNGEDFFNSKAVASQPVKIETAESSPSTEYVVPKTPQKTPKPISTDSGISLSCDPSDGAHTRRSGAYRDGSESPLAKKGSGKSRLTATTRPRRPALTPIQPRTLAIRNFVSFVDPFAKIRNYISKPLAGDDDMKKGYIYAFQHDGKAYTKIGSTSRRPTEPNLKASFEARMDELRTREGFPKLQVVMKQEVYHALRLEKIIHYHLESGRMKDHCACTPPVGKKCEHVTHIEWFSNSLDEITAVTIAWQHWMNTLPYAKKDKKSRLLNPEWSSRLATIQRQPGRDNLLAWLCQNVPKVPDWIRELALNGSELIEDENSPGIKGAFVRSSATGKGFMIKRTQTCQL